MPISPYAVSKLAAESYALSYQAVYGIGVLPFRFFNVFGPRQAAGHAYAAVVPAFLEKAFRGEALVVHGDGGQTRDFTFIDTVTQVLSLAARNQVTSPDPVNLAFGTRHALTDVIEVLEETLGRTLEVVNVAPRPGDVRDSQADNTRLRRLFPDVVPVSLADGLAATSTWFSSACTN